MRDNQKFVWAITYKGGELITPQMLNEVAGITTTECHSTTDGKYNYTYLRVQKRCRESFIEKFMKKAEETHDIRLKEIYGNQHNRLAVEATYAFRILKKHAMEKNPAFVSDGERLLKAEKPQKKQQLAARIAELEKEVEDMKRGNEQLMDENAELKARLA